MSIMTAAQFKRYISSLNYDRIIFYSENQKWDYVQSPINLCLTFRELLVSLNPNMICLKSGDDMVYFERVKHIDVYPEKSVLGVIIDVICEDANDDICYTLIAA